MDKKSGKKWAKFHQERVGGRYPRWPNEAMLKVIFGKYLSRTISLTSDSKILDVGCGFGNNLLPFLDLGCECCGVEIDPEIGSITTGILAEHGYDVHVRQGENRSIPFDQDTFDLVLSINTLHYEDTQEKILRSLKEFKRVLRPGGAVYFSTVGPEHEIYKRAEPLGEHLYRICNYDFRDGQTFFFFHDSMDLQHCLKNEFEDVETGRVTERLMTMPLDFLIAVCR